MLDRLIHFSIQNKLLIALMILGLVIWGGWSAARLPIDAVPDITNNQVQVITSSPSLAAQEVERLITFPVEINMANIPGLTEIRSVSRFGLSVVTLVFTDETDVYWARQQVNERLKMAVDQIPKGVGIPDMAPLTTGLGEIYQYVLHPAKGYEKRYSIMELRTVQDWIVRRQLLGTKGVADISSFGGYLKQYEIALDPNKLRSMNLTIAEVFVALQTNNQNAGGAYIDKRPNAWFIRTEGLVQNLDEIGKIVVKNTPAGIPILISDIGQVQFGHTIRYGAMTRNNEGEVVGGIVMMLKGGNSSQVIRQVKERIAEIKKTLPEGIEIDGFLDRTKLVNNAIQTVGKNLLEGALIVVFVLVLMLGNLRAGLLVASMIPLSMLFAIGMMDLFGVSGNLMSLGALDFGLIVDGAVIIVEATLHHLSLLPENRLLSRVEMDDEVYHSASKIRSSAAFGEIIILIVYLPILVLVGVEGKMFRPMAQTVSFAILGAFILSLTYVPMMSALMLKIPKVHTGKPSVSDRLMSLFSRIYQPFIHFALRRKKEVLVSSLLLFGLSVFTFLQMGGEFIPTLDEGDFAVDTRLLTGSSMEETIDVALKAGDMLAKKFPEVEKVIGKIGNSEIPTDPMPMEACDLMVILKNKDEWTSASSREELANKMQATLDNIPGVSFGFQQPIQMRFNELMTGARQDVAIKIYGEDLDELASQAEEFGKRIGKVAGVKDLYIEKVTGLQQIVVKPDRDRMARFGISTEEINRTIKTAFAGESAGLVYEGEKRFDLVVRLDTNNRKSLEDVRNLFIQIPALNGRPATQIPLSQIADVDFRVGPNQIQRDNTHRRITVAFNVRGRDVESIVEEIKAEVAPELKLLPGYYITYGGQFKNLIEAKERLSYAVPAALGLIFLLLYFTFQSVRQGLLIFSAIPLSAIGGIWALWLRGMPFSISAGVGFIALFGVAVLNGIVLIGEFNRLKKEEGLTDLEEIVLKGTAVRLRPVLMTAMVASLGFLPMALSHGSGAEVQKPLATVVIGGLISATLLTLLVLPVLYIFEESGFFKKITRPGKKALSLIALTLLCLVHQQTMAQDTPIPIAVSEAVKLALSNNQAIHAAQYQTQHARDMKGTATDIGKLNATLMYGQYNSYYKDNNLTISQYIPFPTVMRRQAALYNAAIHSAELGLHVTENDLAFRVKTAYNWLVFTKSKHQLLLRQDTLFGNFLKAASLRLKTGESNMLEKATAESQYYEIQTLLSQNESDIRIYETQLQALLNTNERYTSADNRLIRDEWSDASDTAVLDLNPSLQYFKQQVNLSKAGVFLEKARLLPDINLGYFNQTLIGTYNDDTKETANSSVRFQGVMVGVSVPLWMKPQLSRIKANESAKKSAEAGYKLYQRNLQGQYEQALQTWLKYKKSLDYFEQNALPTAEIIRQNAVRNYQTGNIGYLEFSQGINRSLNIELTYLDNLNLYNQAVNQLEFLKGER